MKLLMLSTLVGVAIVVNYAYHIITAWKDGPKGGYPENEPTDSELNDYSI